MFLYTRKPYFYIKPHKVNISFENSNNIADKNRILQNKTW